MMSHIKLTGCFFLYSPLEMLHCVYIVIGAKTVEYKVFVRFRVCFSLSITSTHYYKQYLFDIDLCIIIVEH